jgi:hypothetical protein
VEFVGGILKNVMVNENFFVYKSKILSCRYSGEMREIGACLDEVANLLWDNVSSSVSH